MIGLLTGLLRRTDDVGVADAEAPPEMCALQTAWCQSARSSLQLDKSRVPSFGGLNRHGKLKCG